MQKLELLCSSHGSPSPLSLPPHPNSVLNLVWTIFLLLSLNCECIYMPTQLLRHAQLFGIPWTVARQVPLVQGILWARILEWVATFSSRGSSQPRDWTRVSCIGRQILYHWATWEASHEYTYLKQNRKFPGGLAVRTQSFHCQGLGSIFGWGTKIQQVMQHGKKKKKKRKGKETMCNDF